MLLRRLDELAAVPPAAKVTGGVVAVVNGANSVRVTAVPAIPSKEARIAAIRAELSGDESEDSDFSKNL